MANIIDGLEKAHCSELIELTSMMETYTIIKRLYVLIYQIKNLFCKLFRKNFISAGMKIEFQNKKSELLRLDIQKLQKCLREDLIKEIRFAGGFNIGNTDDQISVSMLKAVSSLYRKKQYSFMSPAEIVDDLKVKCEKRNPQIIKILPNIWLWCSLILCLCMIFFTIFFQNKVNLSSIIYIGVFLECGVSFLCRRWLALEKLAQVILLSGRSYGTFFSVQTRELSLCKWSSADSEKFERGLRALHTLQIKIREIITGRDKLYELNDQSEKLYQSNLKFIEEIKNKVTENLMEQEEQKRKIQSYLVENTRLEADKKQRLETIATADKQIQYNENLFNRLSQSLVYIISDLWTKRYTSFRFEDDFFKVLVSGFERFSFEIIESRLLELEKTNDQRSLGKYSNGHYVFEFAIEKKRCALIYDLKNGVNIFAIKREFLPNDVGMSEEKLRDTLIEYGLINKKSVSQKGQSDYIHDSANILIKEMAEQIKKGKETIGKLNEQVDSLALEKKTIELEKNLLFRKSKN